MTELLFGFNLTFAAKRWPETDAWAQLVASMGIHHVQYSFDLWDPEIGSDLSACDEIRDRAEHHNVSISSTFTGASQYAQNLLAHPDPAARERAEAWYVRAIQASGRLGARAAGGHMGAMSVATAADPERRAAAISGLEDAVRRLSKVAADVGLAALQWEIMPVAREHPASIESTEGMLDRLSNADVPVELCLDTGHACAAGADGPDVDPYAWLERLIDRCWSVHLQQTDGAADRHWPFTQNHAENGIIDPERILRIVEGSTRPSIELMLEQIPAPEVADEVVVEEARASVEHWQRRLAERAQV